MSCADNETPEFWSCSKCCAPPGAETASAPEIISLLASLAAESDFAETCMEGRNLSADTGAPDRACWKASAEAVPPSDELMKAPRCSA